MIETRLDLADRNDRRLMYHSFMTVSRPEDGAETTEPEKPDSPKRRRVYVPPRLVAYGGLTVPLLNIQVPGGTTDGGGTPKGQNKT